MVAPCHAVSAQTGTVVFRENKDLIGALRKPFSMALLWIITAHEERQAGAAPGPQTLAGLSQEAESSVLLGCNFISLGWFWRFMSSYLDFCTTPVDQLCVSLSSGSLLLA